jgi:hypothetical protein
VISRIPACVDDLKMKLDAPMVFAMPRSSRLLRKLRSDGSWPSRGS